ncbi:MAG: chitobiase/beta-hexosaminidase C-terminal domain-containing protein [Terracidiphilus sp.]
MKAALFLLFLGCVSAFGQDDAGMMAAQQSMQATQQANQQAMQDMQQASQQATQQMMQNATDTSLYSGSSVAIARQPSFSVKAGVVAPGTTVSIKCSTRYAVIYFTTNGWTPTPASRRYRGPIPITATTQLQAIAIAPNMARSPIAIANYTVNGPVVPVFPLTLAADGVLRARTRLHLVTNSTVYSKTAEVGDSIGILLNQDVKLGDTIVIPKGTPVDAVITQADSSGHMGAPGDIAFEADSITVGGTTVPLFGGETLEGANHYSKVRGLILIPVAGAAGLLVRGDDAEIKPGMTFTVAVAEDTPLKP